MQKHNILFNVFKDKKFFLSLIFSLLTHSLLFIILQNNKGKLLGDNYIPIEISVINTTTALGDSIERPENKIKKSLFKKEDIKKKKISRKFYK